ncbi:beta-galactosidase [Myceligenerans crystallogenes]|uniref:Beta-galactosidase n=1 Tax=Myceligenerans crystallogenes TaxID=316335 RepID=A0ABP4ZL12_9MICO
MPDRFTALTADLGLCYGGDYNPEQWDTVRRADFPDLGAADGPDTGRGSATVWKEDAFLMREAGVNLVTVGVFSWARYEPSPGIRDFDWLEEVLDLLHEHGVAVDLATPTASPPAWLGREFPETLPVDADGVRLVAGSRNHFSPASQVYRDHALDITRDLVERFGEHPAVRMWHVGNEFGQVCHGEESAERFRGWLRARYGSIGALNDAWGTAVWSQHYDDFAEIVPPRRMPYHVNPAQHLDWRRYGSDLLRDLYREQLAVIREYDDARPVTTNFMGFFPLVDAWSWAADLDVVADDTYPDPADPHAPADTALVRDLMRSLRGGEPWFLMESATSAVSWRPHNLPKSPERSRLESLQAVARGADGVCFFQWRASRAGAERFHSAMLPHAGPETMVHQGVRRLGADLARLRPVAGGRVPARVAMLWDWPSWWAATEPALPTGRLDPLDQLRRWYRVLWRDGVAVDLVRPGTWLDGYDVVLVPNLFLMEPTTADRLRDVVARGGSLVVGPFTGVVDGDAQVRTGRFPALLSGVLGVSGEEWAPLPDDGVRLSGGHRAEILGERLRADDADVLVSFAEGHLAGSPAVTRRVVDAAGAAPAPGNGRTPGGGTASYLGCVPDDALLATVLRDAVGRAGVGGVVPELRELNATRRTGTEVEAVQRGDALFLLNHSGADGAPGEPAHVVVPGSWTDLLTGESVTGEVTVAPGGAVVLVEKGR